MKLPLEEWIEEVKDELCCYEDGEKLAENWEKEVRQWLLEGPKKDVVQIKGKTYFKIQDEDEIFEIADSYLDAVEDGKVSEYWKKF